MSDPTPRLALATVGDHSQKRIVMNDALMRLDSLVQAQVLSRVVNAQPVTPADGDAYILPPSPTGAVWSVFPAGTFVRAEGGTWEIITFPDGAIVHINDENRFVIRSGSIWAAFEDVIKALDNLTHLGINATADSTNVLALKGPVALLSGQYASAGGSGDLSLVVNKEADGDTAQILLQKDFSTRAVLGLLGDNNLTLKMSPDGSTFVTPLLINGLTGDVSCTGNVTITDGGLGTARTLAISSGNSDLRMTRYSTGSSSPSLTFQKAQGTSTSPADVATGANCFQLSGRAYGGGAFRQAGNIIITVIDPSPGSASMAGQLNVTLSAAGSVTPTQAFTVDFTSGIQFAGDVVIDANRNLRSRIYTVATLPSASPAGQRAQVSDAASPVLAATLTGGGSTHVPVYSDGTNWRAG